MATPIAARMFRVRAPLLVVVIVFVLAGGYLGILRALDSSRERRVYSANPQVLLAGCREVIQQRDMYEPARRDSDYVYLDLRYASVTPELPRAILQLKPYYISIHGETVLVRVSGGMVLRGFAPGVREYGDERIIDGLWIQWSKR